MDVVRLVDVQASSERRQATEATNQALLRVGASSVGVVNIDSAATFLSSMLKHAISKAAIPKAGIVVPSKKLGSWFERGEPMWASSGRDSFLNVLASRFQIMPSFLMGKMSFRLLSSLTSITCRIDTSPSLMSQRAGSRSSSRWDNFKASAV